MTDAARRPRFRWIGRLAGNAGAPPSTFAITRDVFLRLFGAVHLIAIVSLWTQIQGLVGSRGIVPIGEYLRFFRERLGASRYWELPTLCWISSGDGFLTAQCVIGALAAVMLI